MHIVTKQKKQYAKKIWNEIASNLKKIGYNVTGEQCSVKWKNLKQKYKSVRDANNETGNATVSWDYFDLMDELMKTTPEVTPVSLASNPHGFRLHKKMYVQLKIVNPTMKMQPPLLVIQCAM